MGRVAARSYSLASDPAVALVAAAVDAVDAVALPDAWKRPWVDSCLESWKRRSVSQT
jgi:hypothetical protein